MRDRSSCAIGQPVAACLMLLCLPAAGCGESAPPRASGQTTSPPARAAAPAAARESPEVTVEPGALAILRAWDRARARAYASGDIAALRRLYLPGSSAGRADAALLRGYLERGLRVTGMRMQVLEARVLQREPDLLRLRVTDRLTHAVAEVAGAAPAAGVAGAAEGRRVLPEDQASTRVVELRRDRGGRWRVAAVSEGSAPRRAVR
jgi:hypothetical protein